MAAAAALIWLAIMPVAASAQQTSIYPPDPESRTFATSPGGWTGSEQIDPLILGLCLPPLLCPEITNTWVASGGTGGADDGFIRTSFLGLAGAVGGTSRGLWTSPAFTYQGAEGEDPTEVTLNLARTADVAALIAAGEEATYSVQLLNVTSGGPPLTLIDQAPLEGADDWTPIATVSLDPEQLAIGDDYQLRIVSRFNTGTISALITGDADYDNVRLRARFEDLTGPPGPPGEPGEPGPPGPPGSGDGDGGIGTSGLTGRRAKVRGSRIIARAHCLRRIEGSCRVTPWALRRGARSRKVTVTPSSNGRSGFLIPSGEERRISLQVKPKYRKWVRRQARKQKRVLFHQKVRGNGHMKERDKYLRLRLAN